MVDGASADDTMSIVEEYSDNINTVVSEPDAGLYDAYNKGLALATGDIIGFINSDDIYESAGVLSSVASIFEDDSIDACHANLVYVNSEDIFRVEREWRSKPFLKSS